MVVILRINGRLWRATGRQNHSTSTSHEPAFSLQGDCDVIGVQCPSSWREGACQIGECTRVVCVEENKISCAKFYHITSTKRAVIKLKGEQIVLPAQ